MIVLIDNGSKRPAATKNLRRLAAEMSRRVGEDVHPVSLLHSSAIAPTDLDGRPADTLEEFLNRQVEQGERSFSIVPLFFGPSRAIDRLLPTILADTQARYGPLDSRVAPVLCPLPEGEARLIDILEDHVREAMQRHDLRASQVVLVDHGSPVPTVTAVRQWLAEGLARRFAGELRVTQAVMERRQGRRYDFNGRLLEEVLAAAASINAQGTPQAQPLGGGNRTDVVLAMQFISPGRHAGSGGDIGEIVETAMARHPNLRAVESRLVSDHPLFGDILYDRIAKLR
jgi:sirohydrochlorin ferrochelatase